MKIHILQKLFLLTGISLLALLLNSCNEFRSMAYIGQVPDWTVSINEIIKYPRADAGEKEIQSFDGRTIWVRKNYELFSKAIESIKAVPIADKHGYYDLKVKLDEHGAITAMRLCHDLSHPPWAFLINGKFYRTVTFENSVLNRDYTEIMIHGPFDKIVADKVAEYSEPNYLYYNKDD